MKFVLKRLSLGIPLALALLLAAFLTVGALVSLPDYTLPQATPDAGTAHSPRALLIENVHVVDVADGKILPAQTVAVFQGKIAYVGNPTQLPESLLASVTERVNGDNGYLIPGLWDAHIHTLSLSPQLHLPLLVANGVTSVRDMGDGCSWKSTLNCQPSRPRWQSAQRDGKLLAPNLVASASYHIESHEEDAGDEAALKRYFAALIAELKRRDDSFIKPQLDYADGSRAFEILLEVAVASNMQVAGHLPYTFDIATPWDHTHPGQRSPLISIEHDGGLLPQCSRFRSRYDGRTRSFAELLAQFDAPRCDRVLHALATQGIGYVPTHIASSAQSLQLDLDSTQLRYVATPIRALWWAYAAADRAGSEPGDAALNAAMHQAALALTLRAQQAGVPVMVGSDALDGDIVHGFSLHRELRQFVAAGLSPLQALRAATIVPATHFGQSERSGSITLGKEADLALLRGNPLEDIRHSERIQAVWLDGQFLDRSVLDEILEWTAAQARSFKLAAAFTWRLFGGS